MKSFWAATSENVNLGMCAQQRFRSACALAQSDQNIQCGHLDSQGYKVSSCGQRRLWSDRLMRRLIWVFFGRICPTVHFLTLRLIVVRCASICFFITHWVVSGMPCWSQLSQRLSGNVQRSLYWGTINIKFFRQSRSYRIRTNALQSAVNDTEYGDWSFFWYLICSGGR